MKLLAILVLAGCATYVLRAVSAPVVTYMGVVGEPAQFWSIFSAAGLSLFLTLIAQTDKADG